MVVELVGRYRHLQIIEMINHIFLNGDVRAKWGNDVEINAYIFEERDNGQRMIRMANLSVGVTVNGVAHCTLISERVSIPEFNELYPNKLVNVTNGVSRRWLAHCNPELAKLIDNHIGSEWRTDLQQLEKLTPFAEDSDFLERFASVRLRNKERLARVIEKECKIKVNPNALFDVQIKRLHEHKRQQMNLLHIISLYHEILDNPNVEHTPRVFIFGAKAAPGYGMAKQIILAINKVAQVINNDKRLMTY